MERAEAKEPVRLSVTDWEQTRSVEFDEVDPRSSIGELVAEAVQALGLPRGTMFQAVFGERELSLADSVIEVGLCTGDAIRLVPEVRAGAGVAA
jgi:hypothetical protein